MTIEIECKAIEALQYEGADKNGLVGVVKQINMVVVATDSETGNKGTSSFIVELSWARPSSFTPAESITWATIQQWAEHRIETNVDAEQAYLRAVREATESAKKPKPKLKKMVIEGW